MCATRRVLCAVALGLLLAAPAQAQVTTADLVGRVTDTSGGVLPGATVTLDQRGHARVRVAPTGDGGDYVFTLLPIGRYTVTVELQGFSSQSTNVDLAAGDRVALRHQIAGRAGRREHYRDRRVAAAADRLVDAAAARRPRRRCRTCR